MSQPTFRDGLGYEGKVTLTLKSNGRVLESRTYKNSGTTQLFKFLGYCLADDYASAKDLLPSKIMLLENQAEFPSSDNKTNVKQRSSYQGLSQQPTVITSEENQVRVIYSFEVPKNAITGEFNQVALYNVKANTLEDNIDSGIKSFSAYYFLTNGNGSFSPQSTIDWMPSTVLLVEWELIISNKNEDTNNDNT